MTSPIDYLEDDEKKLLRKLEVIKDMKRNALNIEQISVPINPDEIDEAKIVLGGCYENIINVIKYYLDLPEHYYKIISIWIMGSYFHSKFETYPILFLNATRGSGKSRLLKLISKLSANGDGTIQNNLTEAVLFRHPKNQILCIDEVEQIGSKEKHVVKGFFNSKLDFSKIRVKALSCKTSSSPQMFAKAMGK